MGGNSSIPFTGARLEKEKSLWARSLGGRGARGWTFQGSALLNERRKKYI